MAFKVFPTENDVGVVEGDGIWFREAHLAPLFSGLAGGGGNFVLSGFAATGNGTSTLQIGSGFAIVEGQLVEMTTNYTDAISGTGRDDYYLQLVRTSGLVTSAQIIKSPNPSTPPADTIFLCSPEFTAGIIDSVNDVRTFGAARRRYGTYSGDGTNGRTIALSFFPTLVFVTSAEIAAVSGLPAFLNDAGDTADAIRTIGAIGGIYSYQSGFHNKPEFERVRVIRFKQASYTPPQISANSFLDTTHTVTGATVGEHAALASHDGLSNGNNLAVFIASAWVSATNQVTIRWKNDHATAKTVASGNLLIQLLGSTEEDMISGLLPILGANEQLIPRLIQSGFRVADDSLDPLITTSLNKSGVDYHYLAIG